MIISLRVSAKGFWSPWDSSAASSAISASASAATVGRSRCPREASPIPPDVLRLKGA